MYQKIISSIVCFCFIFSNFQYVHARDFSVNQLPIPGKMVEVSSAFSPVSLRGLIVNPKKPLEFEFLVDTGGSHPVQSEGSKRDSSAPKSMAHQNDDIKDKALKDESNRLIKYFLAGLTIPEGDLWVNLSPYEKDRITTSSLGETELGRDLLAQDYILKQLTASLIYPEKDLGREFWNKVYKEAQVKYGTTNIPVNTFNKVWILPDEAQIFESQKGAYVTKATLKVMLAEDYEASAMSRQNKNFGGLEEDYVVMQKHSVILSAAKDLKRDSSSLKSVPQNDTSIIESQIVRDIVLPAITKEVNEGANFAPLRQIYHSLILAKWYKETVANGLLDAVYINKGKIKGINLNDPSIKQQIYNRYLQAYKKGVFNYIKESSINAQDSGQHPRKYFSGGLVWTMTVQRDGAMTGVVPEGQLVAFQVKLDSAMSADAAYSDRKAKLERLTGLIKEIIDSYNQGLNVYLDSLRDVNLIGIKHLIPNSLYIIRNLVDIHQRHPEAVSMKIDIIRREINGLKEILTRFADYQSKDEVLSWAQTILKQIPTKPRRDSPQAGLTKVWHMAKFISDGNFTKEFANHVAKLKEVFDKNADEILKLVQELSQNEIATNVKADGLKVSNFEGKKRMASKMFHNLDEVKGVSLFHYRDHMGQKRYIYVGEGERKEYLGKRRLTEKDFFAMKVIVQDGDRYIEDNLNIEEEKMNEDLMEALFKRNRHRTFLYHQNSKHHDGILLEPSDRFGPPITMANDFDRISIFQYDEDIGSMAHFPNDEDIYFGELNLQASSTKEVILKSGRVRINISERDEINIYQEGEYIYVKQKNREPVKLNKHLALEYPTNNTRISVLHIYQSEQNPSFISISNETMGRIIVTYNKPDSAMAGQVMNGIDSFDKFMDLIKQAKEYDDLEKKLESVYSDKDALDRWLKLLKEVYEENELCFYSLLSQVAKIGNIQPLEVTKIQRKLFKDPKVESYLIRKGLLVKDGSFRGEISLELLVILQAAIRANLRNIDFRYSKEFLLKDEISNDSKIKVLLKKVYIVLKDLPSAQKRFLTLNDLTAAVERILANDFLLEEESLLKSIVAKVSSHTKTVILGDRTYYELDNSSIRFSEIEIKKLVDSMVRELNLYDTQSIALAVYDRWGKEAYDEPTETMDQVVSLIKRKLILKLASGIEEFKTGLFFFNVEKKAKEVAKLLEIKNKILRLKGIDSAMSAFQPSNSQRLSEAAQRIIGFFSHKEEIKRNEIIGFIQSNDIPLEALKEVLETSEQEFYRARIAVCKIIQQILINPSFRTHSLVAQIRTNDFWNFLLSHAYESWGVDGFFKGKERNANVRAAILKTLAEVDINKSLSYLSTSLDYRLEPSPLVRQVAINVINNKLERIKKSNTTGFVIAAIKKAIKEESKVNLIVHHRVLGLLEDHLLSIRQKNDGSRGAGDSAQLAKKPVTLVKAPGGIDLNRIAIKRTGYVIKMEFDPNELNQLLQDGFIGFYPVIMNITPISSPLTLLGQALPKEKEAQVRI